MIRAKNFLASSRIGIFIAIFQIFATRCVYLLLCSLGEVQIKNHLKHPLNHSQRYIIAANHQSKADAFAIFGGLPQQAENSLAPLKFMVASKYYYSWARPLLYMLGCFPAHNNGIYHTYGVKGAIDLLKYGYNICIFPEGRRTLPGRVTPYNGISRIITSYPNVKLLLVHIEWIRYSKWRWNIQIVIKEAAANLDISQPAEIMKGIYRL